MPDWFEQSRRQSYNQGRYDRDYNYNRDRSGRWRNYDESSRDNYDWEGYSEPVWAYTET